MQRYEKKLKLPKKMLIFFNGYLFCINLPELSRKNLVVSIFFCNFASSFYNSERNFKQ